MTSGTLHRRVILLGADFAPSSLPPALRLRFFANHLAEFGWEPTVLTTDPAFCKVLAIFFRESTVVEIVRDTRARDVVSFGNVGELAVEEPEVVERLRTLLSHSPGYRPATHWPAFERYTARAMASQLAGVFDTALRPGGPGFP